MSIHDKEDQYIKFPVLLWFPNDYSVWREWGCYYPKLRGGNLYFFFNSKRSIKGLYIY